MLFEYIQNIDTGEIIRVAIDLALFIGLGIGVKKGLLSKELLKLIHEFWVDNREYKLSADNKNLKKASKAIQKLIDTTDAKSNTVKK